MGEFTVKLRDRRERFVLTTVSEIGVYVPPGFSLTPLSRTLDAVQAEAHATAERSQQAQSTTTLAGAVVAENVAATTGENKKVDAEGFATVVRKGRNKPDTESEDVAKVAKAKPSVTTASVVAKPSSASSVGAKSKAAAKASVVPAASATPQATVEATPRKATYVGEPDGLVLSCSPTVPYIPVEEERLAEAVLANTGSLTAPVAESVGAPAALTAPIVVRAGDAALTTPVIGPTGEAVVQTCCVNCFGLLTNFEEHHRCNECALLCCGACLPLVLQGHPHDKWTKIVGENMSAEEGEDGGDDAEREERSGSASRTVRQRRKEKAGKDKGPTTGRVTRSMNAVPAAPGTVVKNIK